jgi:hypothetical protein
VPGPSRRRAEGIARRPAGSSQVGKRREPHAPLAIQGRAGQAITIDLESDDFDAYLFLRGPGITGGRDFQDDDSGGNCNSRLTTTFPQNGDYEIDVNTTGHYATGSFTLSVTTGSKPKSVARCNRSSQ